MKILLVNAEPTAGRRLADTLSSHGFRVELSEAHGAQWESCSCWDLLIVDQERTGPDGAKAIRDLRRRIGQSAILVLTPESGATDRIEQLNAGADDCLAKPYALPELSARIVALSRRARRRFIETHLVVGELELDLLRQRVTRAGAAIRLQPREFRLLECLMRYAETCVTRATLLTEVWGMHAQQEQAGFLKTHISRLRGKLNHGDRATMIHTVPGVGYMVRAGKAWHTAVGS
jgi:two-component system OmpR family response regulator